MVIPLSVTMRIVLRSYPGASNNVESLLALMRTGYSGQKHLSRGFIVERLLRIVRRFNDNSAQCCFVSEMAILGKMMRADWQVSMSTECRKEEKRG